MKLKYRYLSMMLSAVLFAGFPTILSSCSDDNKEIPNPNPEPGEITNSGELTGTFAGSSAGSVNYTAEWEGFTNEDMSITMALTIDPYVDGLLPKFYVNGVYQGDFTRVQTRSDEASYWLYKTKTTYQEGAKPNFGIGMVYDGGNIPVEKIEYTVDAPSDDVPEIPEPATLAFGYCGDYFTAIGYPGAVLEAAIEIPVAQAKQWVGNTITGMRIGFGKSTNKNIIVYVTKTLTGEALFMQDATMTVEEGWNEVIFDTPYEVDGSPFFIGYMVPAGNQGDYPIGMDYTDTDITYGDWVGLNNDWDHLGPFYGSVCIQALVTGLDLPKNDVAVRGMYCPNFVGQNQPFEVQVQVNNNGTADVESLEFSIKINGAVVATPSITLEEPMRSGGSTVLTIEDVKSASMGGNLPVELEVISVNGAKDETPNDNLTSTVINISDKSFTRNPVVEEFTGTWCGWCPRGLVGMKYMEENYGDKGFIGVAIHSEDAMESPSYAYVANAFSQGSYPSAVIDRTYYFDPSAETLEEYYLYESQFPSFAGIDVDATVDASGIVKVSAVAEFALDVDKANYQVAFGLAENNVGPYAQTNYFAGGRNGKLEGWDNAPSKVSTIYNEVGREIVDPFGIAGSLPAKISKGEKYNCEATFDASGYNIDDCFVVAMIIDADYYMILNGAKLSLGSDATRVSGSRAYTAPGNFRKPASSIKLKDSKITPQRKQKLLTSSTFSMLEK